MKTLFKSITVRSALVLLALMATTLSFAGGGPSPENCEDKGLIDVECIVCDTGEYVGKVSVQAEYDSEYGDCMKCYRKARDLCISTYNMDSSNAGCKWRYSMGGKAYKGFFPSYCEK
jgi:hypothetical protein